MKKIRFFKRNRTIVLEKLKESFSSVLPITLIVLILCFTITPIDSGLFLAFILGAVFVFIGIGLFTLGADLAMTPIGEYVGSTVIKSRKMWLIVPIFFIVGIMITISEPDLQVLAGQLSDSIQPFLLTISVGIGVGLFLVIALLRIVFKIKLSYILIGCYVITFTLVFFVPENFIPLSFDSGGVTTGPMSVPFIIAIGTGVASLRNDKNAGDDSFGLTALCSVGPILSVMILGLIFKPQINSTSTIVPSVSTSVDLISLFGSAFPKYLFEVFKALSPIVVFYIIIRFFGERQTRQDNLRILSGVLYTFFGLVIFLVGVNSGFLPVGYILGEYIGNLSYNYIIIPIGMVLGYFVVSAEPAVHVLNQQVYDITSGAIPKKALLITLSLGVAVSVGLAMMRILLGINILYILIPGYVIALGLTFFVPSIFTAVAFDSGGVASGAMTTSFLMPFALGFCSVVGGGVAEGFGVIALVAMTPLIAIQLLGLIYKIKINKINKNKNLTNDCDEQIIG